MIDFVEHYTYTWVIISVISHLTICGLILCPDDLYGCTLQITSVSLYNFTGVVIAEASSEVSVGSFHELSGHCSCKQQYCAINCCIRMIASLFVLLQFCGNGWVATIAQTNHSLGSESIHVWNGIPVLQVQMNSIIPHTQLYQKEITTSFTGQTIETDQE